MSGDGRLLCMRSGTIVDLGAPDPGLISIEDIASHLASINRWVGCLKVDVSVAAHSVVVSGMFEEPREAAAALLHDATEAYLGDVSWPLKELLGPAYKDREDQWADAVVAAFGYDWRGLGALKVADTLALLAEARMFGPPQALTVVQRNLGWKAIPDVGDICELYREPMRAPAETFLRRWHELTKEAT